MLLIDLAGKQGDLAKHFGVWSEYKDLVEDDDAWPNISTVFDDAWGTMAGKLGDDAVDDLVVETGEGPDLIPAHPGLDTLDAELGNIDDARDWYSRLEQFLDEYVDPLGYEFLLIDLPGMTNNVSYNGLWAAGNVITPAEMGPFEAEQGDALRAAFQKIAENFEVGIDLALVFPNKVDTRTNLAEEYFDAFAAEYPESIAPEYVPYSQDIQNAADSGVTAFQIEDPSQSCPSPSGVSWRC